jgi:isopentenyldiphosphate isomerase
MINKNELLLVVDEEDQPVQIMRRKEVHQKMLIHRISHIWVIDDRKRVLGQKRSMQKDSYAGMWQYCFGGHVLAGETYLENAAAETSEEIGVRVIPRELSLFAKKRATTTQENIFISVYGIHRTLDIASLRLEPDEIAQVKLFSLDDLRKIFRAKDDNWVHFGYELEAIDWLDTHLLANN